MQNQSTIKRIFAKPDIWLMLIAFGLLAVHHLWQPERIKQLLPIEVKQFNLTMYFEPSRQDVSVATFVPVNSQRQTVIEQTVQNSGLNYQLEEEPGGRVARWEGENVKGIQKIVYQADIALEAVRYDLSPDIAIPEKYPTTFAHNLQATDAIQVQHPEVAALWQKLRPQTSDRALPVVQSIFDYTYQQLSVVPFKGLTDALTALRLQQASCNGKSRLFVALARLNNLPARLVGGVILDNGQKKTSHQWVEVYIGDRWVPFDPTNGHFAFIPNNYLTLYRGDQVLFTHTRNINFDYQFDIRTRDVASGVQQALISPELTDRWNVVALLSALGLDEKTASIFILFPLCALCITFFRNVVGITSFGIFMPMLIAAACRYTGLELGLIVYASILLIALAMHKLLERARILKIPRFAAVITVVTVTFLLLISLFDINRSRLELGIIALFPVVVIAFTAERLNQLADDRNFKKALLGIAGSLFLIIVCYWIFTSLLLRSVFALYPALFILVLALQIFIGRWTGVRASEFWRFFRLIRDNKGDLLSINARNRDLVLEKNSKELMQLADDKIASKEKLRAANVAVPPNLYIYQSSLDAQQLPQDIENLDSFVLKPNQGSRGQGILVIRKKTAEGYVSAGGKLFSAGDIYRHCQEILSGSYSKNGHSDIAYIEPLIEQDPFFEKIAPFGLSDVRIILDDGKLVAAMWRVPTTESDGKANLHQGAIGVALDLSTGKTLRAQKEGQSVQVHPDTGESLLHRQLPHWQQIIQYAKHCYTAVPLGYLGVDICVDAQRGPLVLEINARPGLEIQNVGDRGIFDLFQRFHLGISQ